MDDDRRTAGERDYQRVDVRPQGREPEGPLRVVRGVEQLLRGARVLVHGHLVGRREVVDPCMGHRMPADEALRMDCPAVGLLR
jgi:hypothetical protein